MQSNHNTKTEWTAWGLLIILALIWGSSFILMKRGLVVYSAMEVGAIRIMIAFITALPLVIKSFQRIPKNLIPWAFLMGMTGNLLPAFLFATAQTRLDSGVTGVLNSLTPIFTLLIGLVFFGASLNLLQVIGLGIAFMGALGLSLVKSDGQVGELNAYAGFVLLATLLYGISANLIKHKLNTIPSTFLSAVAFTTIMPLAFTVLIFSDFSHKIVYVDGAWKALGYLGLLGFLGTAVGLVLFNRLIQLTDAVFASIVTYLIPIMAIVWGVLDGEKLTSVHFLCMVLIIAGVFWVNKYKK